MWNRRHRHAALITLKLLELILIFVYSKNINTMQYNLVWKLSIEVGIFLVNSHKMLNGTYNKTLMFLS